MKEASQFFAFANERERIRIAKEDGEKGPWTQDPILQQYRFCNVFREDDRTTRYFRKTVRDPLASKSEALIATIAWRWFNRIETCSKVTLREWASADTDGMRAALRGVSPLVTGAYVIKTPDGMNKLEGILACINVANKLIEKYHSYAIGQWIPGGLKKAHASLMQLPYLGRFMAYEVVTDLRHTHYLRDAPDIMTWASAGPGCCRGLGWVTDGNPHRHSYGSTKTQELVLTPMRELLTMSRDRWNYDRPWEMREVEHTLCEYDKYRRAQNGQRLKRKYT